MSQMNVKYYSLMMLIRRCNVETSSLVLPEARGVCDKLDCKRAVKKVRLGDEWKNV